MAIITYSSSAGDITLGGDVTGVGSNNTVAKIQGVVISGTPVDGYVLEATSSTAASWQAPSGDITLAGDVTGAGNANTLAAIDGYTVSATNTNVGQQLVYNGSAWIPMGVLTANCTDANVTVDCGLSTAGTLNASQFIIPAATLSANRTMTVNTDSAVTGESITIIRLDTTAHTYAIANGGTGGGTLITLPASKKRAAVLSFDGTNWYLASVVSMV